MPAQRQELGAQQADPLAEAIANIRTATRSGVNCKRKERNAIGITRNMRLPSKPVIPFFWRKRATKSKGAPRFKN